MWITPATTTTTTTATTPAAATTTTTTTTTASATTPTTLQTHIDASTGANTVAVKGNGNLATHSTLTGPLVSPSSAAPKPSCASVESHGTVMKPGSTAFKKC